MIQKWKGFYSIADLDYMNQTLRSVCLKRDFYLFLSIDGMALLSVGGDDYTNLQEYLMKYVSDPLKSSFNNSLDKDEKWIEPQFFDLESLYIPIGWDSIGKITSLKESFDTALIFNASHPKKNQSLLQSLKLDYSKRIQNFQTDALQETTIEPENDAVFLEKVKQQLECFRENISQELVHELKPIETESKKSSLKTFLSAWQRLQPRQSPV